MESKSIFESTLNQNNNLKDALIESLVKGHCAKTQRTKTWDHTGFRENDRSNIESSDDGLQTTPAVS